MLISILCENEPREKDRKRKKLKRIKDILGVDDTAEQFWLLHLKI